MRTIGLIISLLTSASLLPAQTPATSPTIAAISAANSATIPKFLVYRHFLAWVNDLDNRAVAAGESDPYKFAEPFQNARLQTQDLDALLREAKALDSDLAKHDEEARAVITEYRRTAQSTAGGSPLPPAPAEIPELQAMRTAILVQHMVSLQSALGPQKTAQLEAYLGREFVPHISLKPLVRPPASTGSGISTQPFAIGQQ